MTLRNIVQCLLVAASCAASAGAQRLGIGDPAPALKVSRWLKGDPVRAFEPEQVYVVEFWATWCVPCKKSIPHLTEVQRKFAPRGVTLLAISIWEDDQRLVQPFVDELGEAMGYRVAMDEVYEGAKAWQGSMSRSWMIAAEEESIPSAFIVDGRGRVAWIGNSLEIEEPLEQVVTGAWDLTLAKAANQKRVAINRLHRKFRTQTDAHDWKGAIESIDELNKLDPSAEYKTGAWRFHALLQLGREDEGYAYARKLVEGPFKDEALLLNWIAWIVVDPAAPRKPRRDLAFALEVAKRADLLSHHEHPAILDTLAVVYFEQGEFAKALEIQEEAVVLAKGTPWLGDLEARLTKFRSAAKQRADDAKLATQGD